MKLYIDIKKMTFEEDNIEHEIVLNISDKEFLGYNILIELPDDDKFIKDTLKIEYKKDKEGKETDEIEYKQFIAREQKTWNSFPLYEIVEGKIIDFDYTQYEYFSGTDRRMVLARKINELYNPASEAKLVRKTLKKILDHLNIVDDSFNKYDTKIENIIKKNPKICNTKQNIV